MKRTAIIALGLVGLTGNVATAMPHCGERDAVVATLAGKYSEQHIASGLQSDTGLLEIWASNVDGSWTILMTRPDGETCVVASGTHWLTKNPIEAVIGDPV